MNTPESDEVAAHQYRLAQANRVIRFAESHGMDGAEVLAGRVDLDLDPICDENGKIVPEPIDFESVT